MGIQEEIEEVANGFDGEICVAAKDLQTGEVIARNPSRKCATASVIKLPILVHTLLLAEEGLLDLDARLELKDEDKTPGSGILTQLSAGLKITKLDACVLMIALSDNTATNMVIDRAGIEPVNQRMRSLGLPDTTLFRKVFAAGAPVSSANHKYGLGVTTPRDMLRLLTLIHSGSIGNEDTCARIRSILGKQQHRDSIPRFLPASTKFQGKSGSVDAVRNDVGIVTLEDGREFALAIFCQKIPRPLWTADNPGQLAIAKLSAALIRHFAPDAIDAPKRVAPLSG
jgi:beta-lactamase class A